MAMWRIRINLADDPRSRERLSEVLASQHVEAIQLTPRHGVQAELSGDVVLELPQDEALGEMLTALHTISPQVFVSRADIPADRMAKAPIQHENALLSRR
jgi:Cell division protein FtsQ